MGTDLDMKCVCDGFAGLPFPPADVQSFRPVTLAPFVCNNEPAFGLIGVNCTGGFVRLPQVSPFIGVRKL